MYTSHRIKGLLAIFEQNKYLKQFTINTKYTIVECNKNVWIKIPLENQGATQSGVLPLKLIKCR